MHHFKIIKKENAGLVLEVRTGDRPKSRRMLDDDSFDYAVAHFPFCKGKEDALWFESVGRAILSCALEEMSWPELKVAESGYYPSPHLARETVVRVLKFLRAHSDPE